MWGGYYGYKLYKPVAEKKAEAQKKLAKLRQKNPDIAPIVIEGRKIAVTWWGAAWNKNLESYADYANRIGRGRSYVMSGMVLDLRIGPGVINAKVSGSRKTPYDVLIRIDKLSEARWKIIVKQCSRRIAGISDLVEGKFPEDLAQIFLKRGTGLFPSPSEIHLDCSCPDWAEMCKHVAAALYGVGARLDHDPTLFFTLRGIDFSELLKKSVEEKIGAMLKNAGKKSGRTLDDADIAGLFGL
ncbi:MAG: SWIM zinc finger family protein [Synergistaceae bacterium]|jgi:uncharacterized Zn finger protein|nr:SWIM zinc finger family protein [Synergistaceae bacterium]